MLIESKLLKTFKEIALVVTHLLRRDRLKVKFTRNTTTC